MIFHALLLPGATGRFIEFLKPDLSVLGFREIFAALGQTFFSVGLGGTFVIVYAGFLKPTDRIPSMAFWTAFGDAGSSLLFALFLIPSILVFGLDMASGPGLIFNTFPQLFAAMPGGRIVGTLFLVSISIVGFLSLVAAYQVPYTSLQFEWPAVSKRSILFGIGIIQALLAMPSSFFPEIIEPLDLVFGSGMQIVGCALAILGLTWGLDRASVMSQVFQDSANAPMNRLTYQWIKWVIPFSLLAVLVGYLFDVLS
jgi:NSS family neurotransmitter:Na+ symporter